MSERAAITCDQFALEAEKIEQDSAFFIDTINQQEGLFAALKEFSKGGKGIQQLENMAYCLKNISVERCLDLIKQLEKAAKNQIGFYESHKSLAQTMGSSEKVADV